MKRLPNSRKHWQSAGFEQALKTELEGLRAGTLPLEQATSRGGIVDDSDISVTVIEAIESGRSIQARAGVFFTEIVGGCSCGDDPVAENAYCEILIHIDKTTAEAEFALIR